MAKNVHLILQGKGGVGKTLVASLLAQYLISKNQPPFCIDTDPINHSLAAYADLNAKVLTVMEDDEINQRAFDTLIENIATAENDVIIDNGASSFVALSSYLLQNDIPNLLKELDRTLIIHSVITGGPALVQTLNGFVQVAAQFPDNTDIIAWLNPFFGEIEMEGKSFEQMKGYKDVKSRVAGIIQLPKLKRETFGYDFASIQDNHATLENAINDTSLTIMTRQRLKIIRDKIFSQIAQTMVL